MARIIEYEDRDIATGGGGTGYGGTALVAVLIVLLLYLGGFFPWITNLASSIRPIASTPLDAGPIRPIAPPISPVGDGTVAYVIADNLNMRISPNEFAQVSYILPRGTRVEYMNESYQEPGGDFWVKVRIQASAGTQIGWVSRRYIS